MAQHVRTVLADAALRAALVENARLHVKTSLSWDHIRAEFGTRLEGWAAGGD
jgi:hypothetical protein